MGQARRAGQKRGDVGARSKLPERFFPRAGQGRAGRGEADRALPSLPAHQQLCPGDPRSLSVAEFNK